MPGPQWIRSLRGAELTPTQYRVLVNLASYADPDGSGAGPSVRTLAADCCLNERTIRRTLGELRKADRIIQTRAGGNRYARGQTTAYRIVVDSPAPTLPGMKGGPQTLLDPLEGGQNRYQKGGRWTPQPEERTSAPAGTRASRRSPDCAICERSEAGCRQASRIGPDPHEFTPKNRPGAA